MRQDTEGHDLNLQRILHALSDGWWGAADVSNYTKKVLRRIAKCGTGAFGWVQHDCLDCGHANFAPRGCTNRNCPSCVGASAVEWVDIQKQKVLNDPYFHVVFTLPKQLRTLAKRNPKVVLDALMKAAKSALLHHYQQRNEPVTPALLMVLHTWNQRLDYHPHVHVLITAGGLSNDQQRWVPHASPHFLAHRNELLKPFRNHLLQRILRLRKQAKLDVSHEDLASIQTESAFQDLVAELRQLNWNVHIQPPFGGPLNTLHYLGIYTHRTAISNKRIVHIDDQQRTVTFSFLDRKAQTKRNSTVSFEFFADLYAQHILPKGFHRIRTAGLLAPANKAMLRIAQQLANQLETIPERPTAVDDLEEAPPKRCCEHCEGERLLVVAFHIPTKDGRFITKAVNSAIPPPKPEAA